MKNIIKNIYIVISFVVIVVGFIFFDFQKKDLKLTIEIQEREIAQLKSNQKKEKEISEDKDVSTLVLNSSSTYLEILFCRNGKFYQLNTDDAHLYKNVYLSKKYKEDAVIISPIVDSFRLENGQEIYSIMSTDGPIYTSYQPELEEIDNPKISVSPDIYNQDASKKYIKYKFWKGKTPRVLREDSSQKWYSTCYLSSDSIINDSVEIKSRYIYKITLENQVDVWHGLSSDGTIVWMHEQPEVEDYNE